MIVNETISIGRIKRIIKWRDGRKEETKFLNTVLRTGREALAASLANNVESIYEFYISRMLFGDGGTGDGVPKFVNSERNGLFGLTRAIKPVIATIDPNMRSQVTFTSVLDFDDANGYTLNEMALQMNSGDFYSMATFPDLNKTSSIQISWLWTVSFI